jgi:hypothetical protein
MENSQIEEPYDPWYDWEHEEEQRAEEEAEIEIAANELNSSVGTGPDEDCPF